MLRTNSKKARANVRAYIINHFDPSNYECCGMNQNPETFEEIAKLIIDTFEEEKPYSQKYIDVKMFSRFDVFRDWCQGLPSILDTCYYYNRLAVDDLGAILEETEEEKSKYTESQAEEMLTRLIYRELVKGVEK